MCVFSPAFHHLLPASKSIQGSILPEFLQHPSHWPQLLWSLAWPQQWPEVSPTGGIRLDANVVVFVFPLLVFRDLSVKMFLWPSRKCFKKMFLQRKVQKESLKSQVHTSAQPSTFKRNNSLPPTSDQQLCPFHSQRWILLRWHPLALVEGEHFPVSKA